MSGSRVNTQPPFRRIRSTDIGRLSCVPRVYKARGLEYSHRMRKLMVAAFALPCASAIHAAPFDWPQFLGPDRNGTYSGPPLSEGWGSTGPKVVWRKQVGAGLGRPAVVQGRVLLFHRVGNEEVLESLDAKTGNSGWRYAYPTTYR